MAQQLSYSLVWKHLSEWNKVTFLISEMHSSLNLSYFYITIILWISDLWKFLNVIVIISVLFFDVSQILDIGECLLHPKNQFLLQHSSRSGIFERFFHPYYFFSSKYLIDCHTSQREILSSFFCSVSLFEFFWVFFCFYYSS